MTTLEVLKRLMESLGLSAHVFGDRLHVSLPNNVEVELGVLQVREYVICQACPSRISVNETYCDVCKDQIRQRFR